MEDLTKGQRELANAKASLRHLRASAKEDAVRTGTAANKAKAEFPYESTCEALLPLLRQHEGSANRLMQEGISLEEQNAALERSAVEQRALESSILEENMAYASFQTGWDVEHGELESELHLAQVERGQLRGVVEQLKLQLERQCQQQQTLSDKRTRAISEMKEVEITEGETKKAMLDEHNCKLHADRKHGASLDEQLERRQALLHEMRQQHGEGLKHRHAQAISLRQEAATQEEEFCSALAVRVEAARKSAQLRFEEGIEARLEALDLAEE